MKPLPINGWKMFSFYFYQDLPPLVQLLLYSDFSTLHIVSTYLFDLSTVWKLFRHFVLRCSFFNWYMFLFIFKRRDLCLYVTFLVIFQTVTGSTFTSICEQKHEVSRKVEKLNITEHMIHFYLRNKYKSVYARVYTVKTKCIKI